MVSSVSQEMRKVQKQLNVIEAYLNHLNSIKSLRVDHIALTSVDQGNEDTWFKEQAVINELI